MKSGEPIKKTALEKLHDSIQATAHEQADTPITGAALVGYVVIADYQSGDGDRWITAIKSKGMPKWVASGMLCEMASEF